jgi:hypothetical protein
MDAKGALPPHDTETSATIKAARILLRMVRPPSQIIVEELRGHDKRARAIPFP